MAPALLLVGRLGRFLRLSASVQLSTQLVTLPFGLFASPALLCHPLSQRALRHLAADPLGAEFFSEVAQLVRIIAHNLVQAGRYHAGQLFAGRCALCVQCAHICTCAPNIERIPLYTVNFAIAFDNLVRPYAPILYAIVDSVAVDAEEFSGLPDRDVFLVLLCALCAVLSHNPMLDPSETPRKPSDVIRAALARKYTRAGC
jgi:hypothetical protein